MTLQKRIKLFLIIVIGFFLFFGFGNQALGGAKCDALQQYCLTTGQNSPTCLAGALPVSDEDLCGAACFTLTGDAYCGIGIGGGYVPIPGDAVTLSEIHLILTTVARWLVISSVVIAIIFILYGGVLWITAGSSDDRAKKAKTAMKNGIIGALIVLGVGVIMNTLAAMVTRNFFR